MDTHTAIETRRAVKHFDPEHQIIGDEYNKLMALATCSPTAFNIQNWRFVVARDSALRMQIREAAWDQAQITEASLLIILCADLKAWEKKPERYFRNAPSELSEFFISATDKYYRGNDQAQRDEAMRSCGIAGQTLMLAAKAMNYDSCPMDGFDYEQVGRLINLPADHVISFIVVIGKAVKEAWPRMGPLPVDEVVISDRF